jgi:hypothetical protein
MARGTQFVQLYTRLRSDVRRSSEPALGISDLDNLKQVINRVYSTLYNAYDWPHLRKVFDRVALEAASRYYDFPAGLNVERVERAAVWYNGLPHLVQRGISFEEYAGFNSEIGVTSEPMLRWDVRWMDTTEQIEVWPIPSSNNQELEFIGIQAITPLVADSDKCLLDDDLVLLFAAAEILAADGAKDAQMRMQAAQAHFEKLKIRTKGAGRAYKLGLGTKNPEMSGRAIVRVR